MTSARDEAATKPASRAWWLAGDETCEVCLQRYAIEIECRCIDCDRPLCPMCLVTVTETGGLVCSDCRS